MVDLNKTNFHWAQQRAEEFQKAIEAERSGQAPPAEPVAPAAPEPVAPPAPEPAKIVAPEPVAPPAAAPFTPPPQQYAPPIIQQPNPGLEAVEAQLAYKALADARAQLEKEQKAAAEKDAKLAELTEKAQKLAEYERRALLNLDSIQVPELQSLDPEDTKTLLTAAQKQAMASYEAILKQQETANQALLDRLSQSEKAMADFQAKEAQRIANERKRMTNEMLYTAIPDIQQLQATAEFGAWSNEPIYPGATRTRAQEIRREYDAGNAKAVIAIMSPFVTAMRTPPSTDEVVQVNPSTAASAGGVPAPAAEEKVEDNEHLMLKQINDRYRVGLIDQAQFREEIAAYEKRVRR